MRRRYYLRQSDGDWRGMPPGFRLKNRCTTTYCPICRCCTKHCDGHKQPEKEKDHAS